MADMSALARRGGWSALLGLGLAIAATEGAGAGGSELRLSMTDDPHRGAIERPERDPWRILLRTGNDVVFNSDGGGVTYEIAAAIRKGTLVGGAGLVAVSPDLRSDIDPALADPLRDKGRLVGWLGTHRRGPTLRLSHEGAVHTDWSLSARIGMEGGRIDRLTADVQDAFHDLTGTPNRPRPMIDRPERLIGGVSGHARARFDIHRSSMRRSFDRLSASPYVHGSLGNDTAQLGVGMLLSVQAADAREGIALPLPVEGAYAPVFGGDGLGAFLATRFVEHETLYGGRASGFAVEGGLVGQVSVGRFSLGAVASCLSLPYQGAAAPDCVGRVRLGARL